MTEAAILKILFPPEGAIPLACIDTLPQIRSYIAALTALAKHQPLPKVPGAHRINDPVESMAITLRIIELHDNGGLTWAEIAERIGQGITGGACRHRYQNYMRDDVKKAAPQQQDTITRVALKKPDTDSSYTATALVKGNADKAEAAPPQEAEPAQPEPPTEPEQKTEEPPTIRESRTVQPEVPAKEPRFGYTGAPTIRDSLIVETPAEGPATTPEPEQPASPSPREAALAYLEKLKVEKESKKAEALSPETLAEIDRMLAEGRLVQEISRELEKAGKIVPWTKVRSRAAYLARVKGKGNAEMPGETSTEQHKLVETAPLQEAGSEQIESATEQERKPEPVSISRAELDLRIWDMWKAGKTLDEISDILYSEGLYYSAKSVRVRLLNQGAKL